MTIQELYNWACENHIEDYDIYAGDNNGDYTEIEENDIATIRKSNTIKKGVYIIP